MLFNFSAKSTSAAVVLWKDLSPHLCDSRACRFASKERNKSTRNKRVVSGKVLLPEMVIYLPGSLSRVPAEWKENAESKYNYSLCPFNGKQREHIWGTNTRNKLQFPEKSPVTSLGYWVSRVSQDSKASQNQVPQQKYFILNNLRLVNVSSASTYLSVFLWC